MQSGAKGESDSKPRAILNKEKVIEIFQMSLTTSSDAAKPSAALVSRAYGVSEKTIRDIWTGRTWHEETQPLDKTRQPRVRGKAGRPLGRKDSAPRRRRTSNASPRSYTAYQSQQISPHSLEDPDKGRQRSRPAATGGIGVTALLQPRCPKLKDSTFSSSPYSPRADAEYDPDAAYDPRGQYSKRQRTEPSVLTPTGSSNIQTSPETLQPCTFPFCRPSAPSPCIPPSPATMPALPCSGSEEGASTLDCSVEVPRPLEPSIGASVLPASIPPTADGLQAALATMQGTPARWPTCSAAPLAETRTGWSPPGPPWPSLSTRSAPPGAA